MEELLEEILEFPVQSTFNTDDMSIVEGGEEDGNENE